MRMYSGDGLGDIYYHLVRDVTEQGKLVKVRGQECLELPGLVILEYQKPGACFMRIPGRKFNPFFALAEIVWILSGSGNVEWISYYNKKMKEYQDGDNENFHGAYGLRIRKWVDERKQNYPSTIDQITQVVRKLKDDPFSRQAVISLWDPVRDSEFSKDIPCNNHICYTLRDGKLHQTVTIRSNDLVLGTPHNAVQFTYVHAFVAGLLRVNMGLFTYVIHNLHYYMDLYKPTLSNLIDKAYGGKLEAESIPEFGPFGEYPLNCLITDVDNFRDQNNLKKDYSATTWTSSNRHLFTIAQMLRLYSAVKNDKFISSHLLEFLSELQQPLRDLVLDFWDGTSLELAQDVVKFIRRNNDVSA